MNAQFRGGMQVHAVPEDERSYDAQGKKLPWAYLPADSNSNRKHVLEKGPFGRTTRSRRSISRSKTATPATKDDLLRSENHAYQDQLFARTKAELAEQSPVREQKSTNVSNLVPHRMSKDTHVASISAIAPAGPHANTFKEPTEVILYGFASEYQYSAIEFFETVSKGRIYEDYDRLPPNPRYNTYLSNMRSALPRSLPRDTIRRINEYKGGNHWIKVTFDSPEAAELACHSSPHILHGYSIFAEQYRGTGPNADVALPVTSMNRAGASTLIQRTSDPGATLHGFVTVPPRLHQPALPVAASRSAGATSPQSPLVSASGIDPNQHPSTTVGHKALGGSDHCTTSTDLPRPLRIATAKRLTLRPAAEALLPIAPWPQRTLRNVPVLGALFFGGESSTADMIGAAVPVRENGEFDWAIASFWWKLCWLVDLYLKTNICGLKEE